MPRTVSARQTRPTNDGGSVGPGVSGHAKPKVVPAHSTVRWKTLTPVALAPKKPMALSAKTGPTWTARLLTRAPHPQAKRSFLVRPKAVSAAARRVLPVVRSPKLWTPVQWYARTLMGQHQHRQGVAIPADVNQLQENVLSTLTQSAPRSTSQLKGLVQKVLAFHEAVPAGDPTATVLMYVQNKVDSQELSRKVAAKYCSQLGTALERLGFTMDHPTLKDYRTGLRAIADDEETAQAIPLDGETKDRIAAEHGLVPVQLMWKTCSRWSDLASDAFPARRKHVEFMEYIPVRPALRGRGRVNMQTSACNIVINFNGLTKQTSPPKPQPQWRCDHYVALAFRGSEAKAVHDYLAPMKPDDKLIPWTRTEWLRILRSYPVPPTTLAACEKRSGHFTLHSIKVGASAALRQQVAKMTDWTPSQQATVTIRALRHSSPLCPQALPHHTVCYHRRDPRYIAEMNGIGDILSQL
jgi:hypothetical protein